MSSLNKQRGNPAGKKRSCRFQFSLRSLFLFGFVVSLASSWLGVKMEEVRREQHAKLAIEKIGGRVTYAFETVGYRRWVRRFLGDEFVTHMTMLDLAHCRIGQEELASTSKFQRVILINLADTPLTDEHLDCVSQLKDLFQLDLDDTAVSDGGLLAMSPLRGLATLSLRNTNVTDSGIDTIKTMRSLARIHLEGTRVSASGIARLRQALPNANVSWEEVRKTKEKRDKSN